jgi:ADP-heptose:LPS heptosyltransferase
MDIRTQRTLDRQLGIPLCAAFSLFDGLRRRVWPSSRRTDSPRRILVILLSEMGSLVLARPMFERLRREHPDAELHVLVFHKNREILDLMGVVPPDRVLTLEDRTLGRFVRDVWKLLGRFRRLRFDAVIDCELFARASALLGYLSGAPVRVGFHPHTQEGLYRGSFINRPVPYNPYRHISKQFLSMAGALRSSSVPLAKDDLAFDTEGGVTSSPVVDLSDEESQAARRCFFEDFPVLEGRRLVLIHPGGGALPIRAWPLESYVELCKALLDDGCAVGVIGLASDRAFGEKLTSRCASPRCVDLTGYTRSVRHLLQIFGCASLLVANDGGPGHFAPLAGLASVLLFGPETAALYGPLGPKAHTLQSDLPCAPCLTAYNHRLSFCDGDNQCLKRIRPDQVLAKCREVLMAQA